MKAKGLLATIVIIVVLIVGGGILLNNHYHFIKSGPPKSQSNDVYYCPMHPQQQSNKPGECPICHMSLVKRETPKPPKGEQKPSGNEQKKILYYRNPMNPNVTSPVPMKDQMGMDYVPVYESQEEATAMSVHINPEKQQLIGVKTGKVEKRKLYGQIDTVGIVAYDPDLFVAQEEYLQALKSKGTLSDGNSINGNDSFIKTARRKLLLMGMNDEEIAKVVASGKPEQSLYLPEGEMVWIYLAVYQYESEFVRTGLSVDVETSAYPGEIFDGNIISISPLLDTMTRTFKVRALVKNPGNKLKLETFVNAKIKYDLGEKLAVPEDAIMDAGLHKYVFIAKPDGYFESRTVKLGAKANGFYEVLDGLAEGDTVTTSANFLIDSESKLNAVLNKMSEPNQPSPAGQK